MARRAMALPIARVTERRAQRARVTRHADLATRKAKGRPELFAEDNRAKVSWERHMARSRASGGDARTATLYRDRNFGPPDKQKAPRYDSRGFLRGEGIATSSRLLRPSLRFRRGGSAPGRQSEPSC